LILNSQISKKEKSFKENLAVKRDLIESLKSNISLNEKVFFIQIPDEIFRKQYKKDQFELVVGILNKIKRAYLTDKLKAEQEKFREENANNMRTKEMKAIMEKRVEDMGINDTDEVDFAYFDAALAEEDHEYRETLEFWHTFVTDSVEEGEIRAKEYKLEKTKKAKSIKEWAFIDFLNRQTETNYKAFVSF